MSSSVPIYLDYNATTPMDPVVFEAMTPYFLDKFGNAASRNHAYGCDAARAVEVARQQIAELIAADPREIIFTSGATEAVNLALKGVAQSPFYADKGRHIVTVRTEHKAVLDTCAWLETKGWTVTYLSVDEYGLIDLKQLEAAITDQTVLVSVMHANNETGVIQPIEDIAALCKRHGALFLSDATQSVGKERIDVEACGIDLLTMSAHKMYGPKGVGALYIRRRKPRVRCEAIIHGGGHERGLRSGTLNVPGIVGMGIAAKICQQDMNGEQQRLRLLRDELQRSLCVRIRGIRINGSEQHRLANTLNISIESLDSEVLMQDIPDVAVSSSSACTSAALQPSYVLGAMGRNDDQIAGSIRFSLGRFTTKEEIALAVEAFATAVSSLRKNPRGEAS